jgi:putative transposase
MTCPRQTFNAMIYLLTTGCPWRQLPKSYPHWRTVYGYFTRWQNDGTWHRLHETLRAAVRQKAGRHKHPTAGCLDSQSVRATQVPGVRGFDAFKRLTGRKRHLVGDTQGLLLAVCVTPADVSETAGAVQVLSHLPGSALPGSAKKLRLLWCDNGYFNTAFSHATQKRIELRAVERPAAQKSFVVLPRRWVVERTFAWLSRCRRLARDYETRPQSSEALILLAMSRLMLRRLVTT